MSAISGDKLGGSIVLAHECTKNIPDIPKSICRKSANGHSSRTFFCGAILFLLRLSF